MAPREIALRALQAQAEFDVMGKSGELANASEHRLQAQRRVTEAAHVRQALLAELRRLMAGGALNPAVMGSIRHGYRAEVRQEQAMQENLSNAVANEDERRQELAALRHRAQQIERAAKDEAAATAAARRQREAAQLDDLWLASHLKAPR
jgi:hypothetical protein